jgi:hypothetical protein
MGWKILLLCFIPLQGHQRNDLSQFLNAVDGKIIYVRNFHSAIEQVKCEPLTECPGIIVAVFSVKGKRLELNACAPSEVTQYEQFPVCKACTICFLVNKKIFLYNRASKRNQ